MATLTLELPSQKTQTAFNLRRWAELLADRELARFEGRVETDRHGHIIMSPPPAPSHASFQARIAYLLAHYLTTGRVLTECPLSTADGVKAADVAWASPTLIKALGRPVCCPRAPETCVEVVSPSTPEAEIQEKIALYFDAGAKGVWRCAESGAMSFFFARGARSMRGSKLCPQFPRRIEFRWERPVLP